MCLSGPPWLVEKVLVALNGARVRYLVLGGDGEILRGRLRVCAHFYLVLDMSFKNLRRAVAALALLGYRPHVPPEDSVDWAARPPRFEVSGLLVFQLDSRTSLGASLWMCESFDFEAADSSAFTVQLGSIEVRIITMRSFMMNSGVARPQDLDVEQALELLSDWGHPRA